MPKVRTELAEGSSDRTDALRWAGAIGSALLLHLIAALVLLIDWQRTSATDSESPLAAMTIEVAPLPSAPSTQPTEAPPGPEQVEQRMQRQPRRQLPRFDPPPLARSPADADALAEREATPPEQPQTAQTEVERTTAAPSSISNDTDAAQAPVEGAPSDRGADAVTSWQDRLLAHLEHHKRYPRAAQLRQQQDVVYLRFHMDRRGKVLDWAIARSRGYALLDAEVNALIQRASPLPAPPDDIGGDPIEMVMPVEFFLDRRLAGGTPR